MRKIFLICLLILSLAFSSDAKVCVRIIGGQAVVCAETTNDHNLCAEVGDDSEWDSTSEPALTFDVTETAKNNGSYGWEIDFDGSNIFTYGVYSFTQYDTVYVRFYYKVTDTGIMNNNDGDTINLLNLRDGTTTILYIGLYDGFSGGIGIIGYCLNPWVDLGFVEKADTNWHYVEVYYKGADESTGGGQLWVDGASIGSGFEVDTSAVHPDSLYLGSSDVSGVTEVAPADGTSVYLDDLVIDAAAIGAYPD